jgi:Cft2 family RNA processing exonuclease
LGGLDEILVTHAHLDHTGALPLVHGAFPKAGVWMTEPTLGLLRILLLDAIKVMELKSNQEGEIPLYPVPAVEALLARSRAVPFLDPVSLCGGAIRAMFFPAGHVLGAAAVGLETPEGNVLVTGDVSLTDQLTVSGMPRPRFSPDVVVCESTYGARLHASRKAEEERLAETVLDVLRDGGKVLIPAFALGRAQEVLLILRRALARDGAPAATVYVDGMVRSICGVYSQFGEYLSPPLRERAASGRGLFYTADGRVRPVGSPEEREAILAGGPCVIVASSGMLAGGPSAWYAARLASDEKALIAITGYQDEEAPGRRLQEVASGASKELSIDGRFVPVRCKVATYALSAHADAQELTGLVTSLSPREVVLVHGDGEAREALSRSLFAAGCQCVHLPATGDTIEVEAGAARTRPRRAVAGIGQGRPLDGETLRELHRHLWQGERRGAAYSASDLAEAWYGTAGVPVDLTPVRDLLRSEQQLFVADAKRPFLYRCADPAAAARPAPSATGAARDDAGRLEQNAALALVDELLGPDSGLYRKGAERETWSLRLCFRFPDVARSRHAQALEAIAARTGWNAVVHPEPHLASIEQLALQVLGEKVQQIRKVAIHATERVVRVSAPASPEAAWLEDASRRFEQETGFKLEVKTVAGGTPAAKQAYDATGRLEINLALAEIEKAFTDKEHRPYKKSKKAGADGEWIELTFVSPEVGARYQDVIDDLAYRTSWIIRIGQSVDQQAVLRIVKELMPAGWQVSKGPGLDVAGRKVKLKLAVAPTAEEIAAVRDKLVKATGFSIE